MVALVMFDDVEMEDMTVARQFLGELEAVTFEAIGVALGPGAALIGPVRDVLKLDTQERGVEIIEAAVEPKECTERFREPWLRKRRAACSMSGRLVMRAPPSP